MGRSTSSGEKSKDICRYCKQVGHWASECKARFKEQANLVQAGGEDEEQSLLMPQTCGLSDHDSISKDAATLHLVEEVVQVHLGHEGSSGAGSACGTWTQALPTT